MAPLTWAIKVVNWIWGHHGILSHPSACHGDSFFCLHITYPGCAFFGLMTRIRRSSGLSCPFFYTLDLRIGPVPVPYPPDSTTTWAESAKRASIHVWGHIINIWQAAESHMTNSDRPENYAIYARVVWYGNIWYMGYKCHGDWRRGPRRRPIAIPSAKCISPLNPAWVGFWWFTKTDFVFASDTLLHK